MDYEKMTDDELYELAVSLREGSDDEEPDLEEAVAVTKLAVDRGNVAALTDYGVYLMNGEGIEKDEAAAIACWQKAALQDFPPALYKLGVCYLQGVCGVEKDEALAVKYFTKAAEGGNADSMLNLSVLYGNGIGVAADAQKSQTYLEMAAAQEQPAACCYLGVALALRPNSSDEDKVRGAKLLETAAEAGYTEGQFFYGTCCEQGCGVEKDLSEAAGWYRRAAKAGMPQANQALMNLGFPGVM